jgi:hypothetical protein
MASLEDMSEDERNSAVLKRLMGHPEFGKEAKRLWKKIEPSASFPDVEMDDKLSAERESTNKEIATLREKLQMQEIEKRRDSEHAKVRDAGLDPVAVEKVMTEEKISSYDTAIKYVKAQQQLAPSTPSSVTPIRMPEDLKDIQKNPAGWAREKAFEAINELKAKRG